MGGAEVRGERHYSSSGNRPTLSAEALNPFQLHLHTAHPTMALRFSPIPISCGFVSLSPSQTHQIVGVADEDRLHRHPCDEGS